MGKVTVAKGNSRKAVRQPGKVDKSVGKEAAARNPLLLKGGSGSGNQGSNMDGAGNAQLSGTPGGSGGEQGNAAGRTPTQSQR